MTSTPQRKRFITFEGGEGTGKSTQVRLLAARLERAGHRVVVTREPGGTPFAEDLRATLLAPRDVIPSPLSQALVFYAARADHVSKVISPALTDGAWVICDRFADSTRVYQGIAGGVETAALDALDDIVLGDERPALTFVLDLDVDTAMDRVLRRRREEQPASADSADMFEARDLSFHHQLRFGFQRLAQVEAGRCRLIDASVNPDSVAVAVWQTLSDEFGV